MGFDIWPMVSVNHNLYRCNFSLYLQSVGIFSRFDICELEGNATVVAANM